jgi:hypothetical protein
VQERRQLRCRILLRRWQGTGINVQRDLDPLMAQALLHHFDRYTSPQQQCRTGMPQAMKLDRPHASRFDQTEILVLPDAIHLERMAQGVAMPLQVLPLLGEYKPMIMIIGPIHKFELRLVCLVLPEQCRSLRGN